MVSDPRGHHTQDGPPWRMSSPIAAGRPSHIRLFNSVLPSGAGKHRKQSTYSTREKGQRDLLVPGEGPSAREHQTLACFKGAN